MALMQATAFFADLDHLQNGLRKKRRERFGKHRTFVKPRGGSAGADRKECVAKRSGGGFKRRWHRKTAAQKRGEARGKTRQRQFFYDGAKERQMQKKNHPRIL